MDGEKMDDGNMVSKEMMIIIGNNMCRNHVTIIS